MNRHRIVRLTMAEFRSARAWALRHPFTNPFTLHRKKEWCFVAAAQQMRLDTLGLF